MVGHPGIMLSAACRSLQAVWGLVLRSGSQVWFSGLVLLYVSSGGEGRSWRER